MEKLKDSLQNMVGVLVGVAVIVGLALAYVNHLTEAPIKEKAEQTLAQGIKDVMGTTNLKVTDNQTVTQTFGGKEATFCYPQNRGQLWQTSWSRCGEHHRRFWWRPQGVGRL